MTASHLDHVDWDCKPDTRKGATTSDDRCVNTDQLSPTVQQHSARVPWIDCSICLNDVLDLVA